jgi:hypothetical protein
MKGFIFLILAVCSGSLLAQTTYGTPPEGNIPDKLKKIPLGIEVRHFPKINDPVKINNNYYWKHATAILSVSDDVTIIEFGAYLFYNNRWNLRKRYNLSDMDLLFGTKQQVLQQGEPYVYSKNWRISDQLFGGWALWYFIGINTKGHTICGYATIHTTDNLLNN